MIDEGLRFEGLNWYQRLYARFLFEIKGKVTVTYGDRIKIK